MRLSLALILAAAAPAAAQQSPMSFDAAKQLPLANGQWIYSASAGGSSATYGTHILLRCDRATGSVSIERPNVGPETLTITTDTAVRTIPGNGRMLANNPLLDAIAFSRGRFIVSGGSGPAITVPSWPEAARSIEDCRN